MKNEPLRYIKHQDIDSKKWDSCIANSQNRQVYATSWHLDHATEIWDALVMGDYKFVMPLPIKSKWGIKYVFQPLFCQQLGIYPTPPEEIAKQFYLVLTQIFRYVDTQINSQNTPIQHQNDIEFTSRRNYILPMNMSYAGLFSAYSTNTKRNLKKAEKNSLNFVSGISLEDYLEFKSENLQVTLSKKELERLKSIIAFGQYKGTGKIYGVYTSGNELCAAVYFCRYENRVTYMNAASDKRGKELGAMAFLIDKFIQQNAGKNLVLDFEGSMIPGVARFYKGFGAYPETYFQLKYNRLPLPLRWLKRI
ncbi:hypothetical protein [Maribellus maritimus]|uniref:hypothetical protein n=1 Tax=Maribellus maritimus TaxID=2870838 RepID=UPI001EEC4D42|nr:hypothetical protein [Maribellus maritimus]MCG6189147.1 hypothetical protein [Maribellus maritimus]